MKGAAAMNQSMPKNLYHSPPFHVSLNLLFCVSQLYLVSFLARVVLDLPQNRPTSLEGEQFQALAAEAACGLPIQQVLPFSVLAVFQYM